VNWAAAGITAAVTIVAAVAGNLFIPKAALAWFRALRWPRWLVPYPVLITAGILYYLLMITVLYRALDRHDAAVITWSIVVLIANEAWNAVFFGLRSTRGGFVGILAFTVPLIGVMIAARQDPLSLALLALYAAWVVYDLAWTFALWRNNSPRGER
jgi:tryptophan-rich sensory protein